MGRFLSHLKHLQSCFIRYKTDIFIADKALLSVFKIVLKPDNIFKSI